MLSNTCHILLSQNRYLILDLKLPLLPSEDNIPNSQCLPYPWMSLCPLSCSTVSLGLGCSPNVPHLPDAHCCKQPPPMAPLSYWLSLLQSHLDWSFPTISFPHPERVSLQYDLQHECRLGHTWWMSHIGTACSHLVHVFHWYAYLSVIKFNHLHMSI